MRSPAIEFRTDEETKRAIFRYAKKQNSTVSNWIRSLAIAMSMPENNDFKGDRLILKALKSCSEECEAQIRKLEVFNEKVNSHIQELEGRGYGDDIPWWETKTLQDLLTEMQ